MSKISIFMTDPKRTKHSQNITFNEKSAILEFFYKALQNFQSPVADLAKAARHRVYVCKPKSMTLL